MKRILCFGDSNTWGFMAGSGERFPEDVRWTGILGRNLPDCRIIEEGYNGRAAVWDDPIEDRLSGKTYLMPCYESQAPLDLIILMLGSNDIKHRFAPTAADAAAGVGTLVNMIQTHAIYGQSAPPKILVVRPAPLGEDFRKSPFYGIWTEDEVALSKQTAPYYRKVAEQYGCGFLDAEMCSEINDYDCVHFTERGHALFAAAVTQKVKEMLEIS